MNPNLITIDLDAIQHNFGTLRELAGESALICVVKSDGYGHGLLSVAGALSDAGAKWFAVAHLEELVSLRNASFEQRILILPGIMPSEAAMAVENDATVALYRADVAHALSEVAMRLGRLARCHIKIDTGMSRLGVLPHEFHDFLEEVRVLPGLAITGAFSHFAVADVPGQRKTTEQFAAFADVVQAEAERLPELHIANTGGILGQCCCGLPLARAGIGLYGTPPADGWECADMLRPAMRFSSSLLSVKTIPAGATVSYGATHLCANETRVGVVPVGYDDGYPRSQPGGGVMLVRGRRVPVLGRVCMNLTMVDLSEAPDAEPGDEVVVLGRQGDESILVSELARRAGVITYEILCALGKQNPREMCAQI
ncbi:MAG: alanine racemase [Lentisphaeria bacterium]|nr:alanine racemase [Lentisphaeria bacterium]